MNLFDELQSIMERQISDFFEVKGVDKTVSDISFSAEAISPTKVSVQSNISDTDTFYDFIEVIDKTIMNAFVDLFRKGENVEGSIMDISFSYMDYSVDLGLTAKKIEGRHRKNFKDFDDWYSVSISNLEISSNDTDFDHKLTFVERVNKQLKERGIKSDDVKFISTVFEILKSFLEKKEDERMEKIKPAKKKRKKSKEKEEKEEVQEEQEQASNDLEPINEIPEEKSNE